jgi:hypothetical protein
MTNSYPSARGSPSSPTESKASRGSWIAVAEIVISTSVVDGACGHDCGSDGPPVPPRWTQRVCAESGSGVRDRLSDRLALPD